MSVTFELFALCMICGCRSRGGMFTGVRVNARSLRSTRPSIYVFPAPCPECKGPVASEYRMYLSPESRRAVEAVRGRLRERTAA